MQYAFKHHAVRAQWRTRPDAFRGKRAAAAVDLRTMHRHTLAAGAVLWKEGDPAPSFGVVDAGKVGVRSGRRLLGIVYPKMCLGESAILGLAGATVQRTASVFALEDGTAITEYPAAMVKETFGVGVPRTVLRTLCGHSCRNALLLLAAHPDKPVVRDWVANLVMSLGRCEKQLKRITTWDEFIVAFQLLYTLREASDGMMATLFPGKSEVSEMLVRASASVREIFKAVDLATYVEQFLVAESERRGHPDAH